MTFCGHCGLQLSPGSTRCPRCSASVEPAEIATGSDLHMDDATIASRAFIAPNQGPSQTPINQQPLVLRGNSQGTQDANGATSRVEQVNYNTQAPPIQRGISYSGYPPPQGPASPPFQSNSGYLPPPGPGNPPFQSNNAYPIQNTGSYQPQAPYPGYQPGMPYTNVPPQIDASYQQYQSPYPPQQQPTNAKGRTTGLIIVFIGLILILSAALLFAMQQGFIGSKKTSGNSGGATPALTATQSTQNIVQYSHANYLYALPSFDINYKQNSQKQFIAYSILSEQGGTMNFIVPVSATNSTYQAGYPESINM